MKKLTTMMLIAGLCLSSKLFAADIAGTWTAAFDTQVGKQEYTYTFSVVGSTVTGSIATANGKATMKDGMLDGDTLTFTENLDYQGQALEIKYTGTVVSDSEIKFTRNVGGIADEELTATRTE